MKATLWRRIASVYLAVCLFFLILTVSIGLPIYIRPFYYAHIDAMDLAQNSGFTEEEIRQAYDQVLDYLTLPGKPFGTGVMAHSDEGAAHFADCKVLFNLNAWVLAAAAVSLMMLLFLRKRLGPYRIGKRSAAFYAGLCAVVLPVVLAGLASLNFEKAFVIFHTVFFPGKSNWVFDSRTDEIIQVLPEKFFMHCGILIAAGVVLQAGGILIWEFVRSRKNRRILRVHNEPVL